MSISLERREWFRIVAIRLRNDHLEHCDGKNCCVSLDSIREMAEAAGAQFSPSERSKWPLRGEMPESPSSDDEEEAAKDNTPSTIDDHKCIYCGEPMKRGDGSYWCMNKKCAEQLYPEGKRKAVRQ